jgi:hypothetical protein
MYNVVIYAVYRAVLRFAAVSYSDVATIIKNEKILPYIKCRHILYIGTMYI